MLAGRKIGQISVTSPFWAHIVEKGDVTGSLPPDWPNVCSPA
jgi:hypothetical protein